MSRELFSRSIVACLAIAGIAALATAIFLGAGPPIIHLAAPYWESNPALVSIAVAFVFLTIFDLSRQFVLRSIAIGYRVIFASMPGAGRLHFKQDGLMLIKSDGGASFLF